MKIIPAVFSSCKRGDIYYSPQYPDETSQSLGFSKWGNSLGQRLPEGAKCPWPHSLFSQDLGKSWEELRTVCIPPSSLAAGICNAHFRFLLCIVTVITSGVAAWQDGPDMDYKRNSSQLYQGLKCVMFWSSSGNPLFLCPTSKEKTLCAVASLSSATACPLGKELLYCSLLSKPWEKLLSFPY